MVSELPPRLFLKCPVYIARWGDHWTSEVGKTQFSCRPQSVSAGRKAEQTSNKIVGKYEGDPGGRADPCRSEVLLLVERPRRPRRQDEKDILLPNVAVSG